MEHLGVPSGAIPPQVDVDRIEVVEWDVAAVLGRKSGVERLRLAHEAWELARDRLMVFLGARHPELNQEEVETQVAKRLAHESG